MNSYKDIFQDSSRGNELKGSYSQPYVGQGGYYKNKSPNRMERESPLDTSDYMRRNNDQKVEILKTQEMKKSWLDNSPSPITKERTYRNYIGDSKNERQALVQPPSHELKYYEEKIRVKDDELAKLSKILDERNKKIDELKMETLQTGKEKAFLEKTNLSLLTELEKFKRVDFKAENERLKMKINALELDAVSKSKEVSDIRRMNNQREEELSNLRNQVKVMDEYQKSLKEQIKEKTDKKIENKLRESYAKRNKFEDDVKSNTEFEDSNMNNTPLKTDKAKKNDDKPKKYKEASTFTENYEPIKPEKKTDIEELIRNLQKNLEIKVEESKSEIIQNLIRDPQKKDDITELINKNQAAISKIELLEREKKDVLAENENCKKENKDLLSEIDKLKKENLYIVDRYGQFEILLNSIQSNIIQLSQKLNEQAKNTIDELKPEIIKTQHSEEAIFKKCGEIRSYLPKITASFFESKIITEVADSIVNNLGVLSIFFQLFDCI